MNVDIIKRVFQQRPFRSVVLSLHSGEKIACPSPEVWVSAEILVTFNAEGGTVLVPTTAISSIHTGGQRKKQNARKNGKRT
ncbi:MAG: hypothetical protein HY719_13450 [Planctomycetes bacterium]|nr:hypothetical protein [Planctomycetota bacterium]